MSNGNEQAFASATSNGVDTWHDAGLTKRECFAAMAMQGYISSDSEKSDSPFMVAEWAVQNADALLAELEKTS
jgi:hypothetical protein